MGAIQISDQISLVFTTVLDQRTIGLIDEAEEEQEPTDRSYWETKRGTKATVAMVDELLKIAKTIDPGLELKYNKFYIGLAKDGEPNNFVIFRPKKQTLRMEPRIKRSDEVDAQLEAAGLELMDYDGRWSRYRVRLSKDDIKKHGDLLTELFRLAAGV